MKPSDLVNAKITCIGAGNMAEALIKGFIGNVCVSDCITVTDIQHERLEYFQAEYRVAISENNGASVRNADVVILAVKPQHLSEVLEAIRDDVNKVKTLFVSIAAGVTTLRIEELLGGDVRVVRVMPNTPALIGAGAAAVCGGKWTTEEDVETATTMLEAVGVVVRVQEADMDAVTAVSGSGPAYVFFVIEAMQKAAVQMNLDAEVARKLILATLSGATRLCEETGEDAGLLRERVTSKGGTTAAALNVLTEKKVSDAWVEALLAAQSRSIELSGG